MKTLLTVDLLDRVEYTLFGKWKDVLPGGISPLGQSRIKKITIFQNNPSKHIIPKQKILIFQ